MSDSKPAPQKRARRASSSLPTTEPEVRTPPFSIEAEQAVLGALMLEEQAYDRIADRVTEEDFYRRDHRVLFQAISELKTRAEPCDAVTMGEWLRSRGLAEEAGGIGYIVELANNAPGAANIVAYADIVRDKSIQRSLLDISSNIANAVYNPEGRDARAQLELAEQDIYRLAETGQRSGSSFKSMNTVLIEAFRILEQRYSSPSDFTGLRSGFLDLDKMTAGLQSTDLIIVAARPSMGKTAFAMNIAEYAALNSGLPVAVFSMEMSTSQLALRLISSLGRISQERLRTGRLLDQEWPRVTATITLLQGAKLFVDDTPALSPTELRSRARRLKREHGLGLVVIDYLQLMQVPSMQSRGETKANEIGEISRNLKAMAKELNVPVIALSQLNRAVEQRTDKRPMMSDLRESGSIEQDADLVMFIYRDEYYNKDSPDKGLAEVIVGKHRNGATGKIKLKFWGEFTRFDDFAPSNYSGHLP
jgi:replicative DNA helicase